MSFYSKIRGTMETIFQLGKSGPNLKNASGVIEARDTGDAAYALFRASDSPVGDNDVVTLKYFNDNNNAATGVTMVKLPIALASVTSTTTLPDNAIVTDCYLDVTTGYDGGTTILVDRTGDATVEIMGTSDNNPVKVGTYHVPQTTDWGSTGAGTVDATVTGGPAAGASVLYIKYSNPNSIA